MPSPRPLLLPLLLATLLGGCSMGGLTKSSEPPATEAFDSANTYSRSFDHSPAQACEAARRALLSQGFVVGRAEADVVEARKYFQQNESHEQVEFRAVCMPQYRGAQQTVVFVNAVQDRYALRKSNSNASLGVSALGSLSVPIGSSEDSLVKVASATLQDPNFYKRFFAVLERFLPEEIERPAKPAATTQAQPSLFAVPQYQAPEPAAELPREEPLPEPPPVMVNPLPTQPAQPPSGG
ncbi:DUF2242 domain-containing protein [Pseudoxanthomonas sp. J35]|uniref:DUF2242 domain-containing protein n=1 Tax=Pseudoxanthomonas sp. J35 TaxID=935852 RepID=UPI0004B8CD49|nr:DUF2242 domain-containing protein [Pseudoxanthomonas sp. J35]